MRLRALEWERIAGPWGDDVTLFVNDIEPHPGGAWAVREMGHFTRFPRPLVELVRVAGDQVTTAPIAPESSFLSSTDLVDAWFASGLWCEPPRVVVGTAWSVWWSHDDGSTWERYPIPDPDNEMVLCVAVDPASGDVYAGTTSGVLRLRSGHWFSLRGPGRIEALALDGTSGGLLALSAAERLFRLGSEGWTPLAPGGDERTFDVAWIQPAAAAGAAQLVLGYRDDAAVLWRYRAGTFAEVRRWRPDENGGGSPRAAGGRSIAIEYKEGADDGSEGFVELSEDDGATWFVAPLPEASPIAMAFSPDGSELWVARHALWRARLR